MSPIPPFGWNNSEPPAVDAQNLEQMLQDAGSYTDAYMAPVVTVSGTAGLSNATYVVSGIFSMTTRDLDVVANNFIGKTQTSADQHLGLQAAFNEAGLANCGVQLPPFDIHMGQGVVTFPAVNSFAVVGYGANRNYAYLDGGSRLIWDSDVSGAPHLTYGIDMTTAGPSVLRNVTLVAPNRFFPAWGVMPCALGGVRMGSWDLLENCSIGGFSSCVGMGGGTSAGFANTKGYDHNTIRGLNATGGYCINLLPGSISGGDQHFYDLNLQADCAAFAMGNSSAGFAGSFIDGGGLLGPIAVLRYNDGLGGGAVLFDGVQLLGAVSFETATNAAIFDELYNNGAIGGQIDDLFMADGFYEAPGYSLPGWGKTVTVLSSSGDSITISDNSGFYWRVGMSVQLASGGTGSVPANTVISSITGSWPWDNPTFTLNNSVTNPSSVVIEQPVIATMVTQSIGGVEIKGGSGISSGYPYFYAQNYLNNNTVEDGGAAYAAARISPLTGGGNYSCYGTIWGNGASVEIMSARMNSGQSCAAGDLLMTSESGGSTTGAVQRCDGTRAPRGTAFLTTGAGGSVDYQTRGTPAYRALVNNRSGGNIAPYALLKLDTANPGGVTTASGLSDGYVVGVNGSLTISGGMSGYADELWIHGGGGGSSSGGGAVSSVFGRTGSVTAQSGDYTVSQVTGAAPLASPAITGNPTAPTQAPLTDNTTLATTGYTDAAVAAAVFTVASGTGLTPTPLRSISSNIVANTFVPVTTISGNITLNLPLTPPDHTLVGAKMVIASGTNMVTITTSGNDVFNKVGGGKTASLSLPNQGIITEYSASQGIWYVQSDDLPLSQLDSRYTITASQRDVGELAPALTASGVPWYPQSPTLVLPFRHFGRRIGVLPDDLFVFNPLTETDIMKANGTLDSNTADSWGIAEWSNMTKVYQQNGISWIRPGAATSLNSCYLPLDGLMAIDEWQFTMFLRARGYDLSTLATTEGFSSTPIISFGTALQSLTVQFNNFGTSPPNYGLQAILSYWDFVASAHVNWGCLLTLTTGDFPADTAAPIALSFDQTNYLLLTAGLNLKQANNNNNTGSPVASRIFTWSGDLFAGGGISIGGTNGDYGVDFSFPVFARYSNAANLYGPDAGGSPGSGTTPGAIWRYRPRPKMTFNAQATGTTYHKHIGGVVNATESVPGATHWTALGAAGCPLVRLAQCDSSSTYSTAYAIISSLSTLTSSTATQRAIGGGGTIGGTAIGINWANFDASVLAIYNAGIDIHGMIGYTDPVLQGSYGGNQGMPASNANFALWASAIYGRYLWLATQATGGGQFVDATFWNEPGIEFAGFQTTVAGSSTGTGSNINVQVANSANFIQNDTVTIGSETPTITNIPDTTHLTLSSLSTSHTVGTAISPSSANIEAAFANLYVACTQQINADQTANGNNGVWLQLIDDVFGLFNTTVTAPYTQACLQAAAAASPQPQPTAINYHDYSAYSTALHQNALFYTAFATTYGFPGLTPRNSEFDSTPITDDTFPGTGTIGSQAGVERTSDIYQAAATYAEIIEMLSIGMDMACFFAADNIITQYWSAGQYGCLFDSNANSAQIQGDGLSDGKPTMVMQMYEMFWKHHAGLTGVQQKELWSSISSPPPWPNLRGLLTVGINSNGKTVVTATYGSFRHVGGHPSPKCRVDLEWTLPYGMTVASWKQWGISDNLRGIGRLPVRAQDFSSNAGQTLPIQDYIDWESVNCIQIIGA